MSTTFEIGRWPAAIRRCFSHSGDGPDLHVLEHARGEAQADLGVGISTLAWSSARVVAARARRRASVGSSASGAPVTACRSRATPYTPITSGRFGVTSSSSTSSVIGRCSASGAPGVERLVQHHDPGVIGADPHLVLGQDHPAGARRRGASPRRACCRLASPRPGSATATVWPAATLGAPHTIVRGSPAPSSTTHTAQPVGVRVAARPRARCRSRTRRVARPPRGPGARASRRPSSGRRRSPARRVPGSQYERSHADRHPHGPPNCSSRRTSFSNSMRRSGTSCTSIAIRSMPIPNAKPWTRSGS